MRKKYEKKGNLCSSQGAHVPLYKILSQSHQQLGRDCDTDRHSYFRIFNISMDYVVLVIYYFGF